MNKIEGVIFDVDGTLIKSNQLIFDSFNYILSEYKNITWSPEELFAHFGPTEEELIDEIFESNHQIIKESYYNYYKTNHNSKVKVYEGIVEVLELLHQKNIPMGIYTAKGRISADISLVESGIKDYFSVIVAGDDVENGKPFSDGVDLFLDAHNVERKNVLMVGDSPSDVLTARNSGIKGCSALWDSFLKTKMLELGNDFEFNSVNEFKSFFDSILN